MGRRKIAVVFGGQSSEHEVSRVSAEEIIKNMDREKYKVEMIGVTRQGRWLRYDGPVEFIGDGRWQAIAEKQAGNRLKSLYGVNTANSARQVLMSSGAEDEGKSIDVVFPVIHGCNGEDGTLQGLLELAGLPYVGCGVLSSALGMDKGYAKMLFERAGIPQGAYRVFTRNEIEKDRDRAVSVVEREFEYPCFVKPCNSGSSVGITKAHDRKELLAGFDMAAEYDRKILIEEFIDGREIECAVLGNDEPFASVPGEIIPCNEFYDYEAKYDSGSTSETIIPADIPEKTSQTVREYAVRAFRALDCSGLARVDFFTRSGSGEVLINEINTMPGFTRISMYPMLWEASGVSYGDLIGRLIELAAERHEQNRRSMESSKR